MNRFKLWNQWRKININGRGYQLLVLLRLQYSPTFELYYLGPMREFERTKED